MNVVHRLQVKKNLAVTDCGLNIVAFYPMNMYAMTDEAGKANIKVSLFKTGVTCKVCKEREKDGD